jgi:vitamin B12 transporter
VPGFQIRTDKAQQTTRSIFALHQITLAERLHLSLGGRIDDVEDVDRFATWRGTVAYEVPGTETKLRASVGTGGKAPSLYQFYSQLYGTRTLESERSVGIDAGIDQTLLDGRVKLSGTVFFNRYRNFIDFASSPRCRPDQIFGCYLNVARAETSGFEGSAQIDLIPQWLKVRATYTYMDAVDLVRDKKLALRPEHEGRLGFIITPMKDLTIEPVVTMVGPRFSAANETQKLKSYARLDMNADYKLNERVSLFARLENLTNAHYQEVRNYGTPGRSVYGGLRATW